MAIGTSTAEHVNTRERYQELRAALMLERATFDAHWRELGEYLFPRRTRFFTTDRNKGDRRTQNIINSTPRFAARTLQSGLHAGLTSPARPWLRLSTPDPDMAEFGPVKEWLHLVTQRILTVFLKSNLYNGLPTLYGDLGTFGTAAMGIFADDKDLIRAYSYPIGSFALGLDARGIATTFVRDYVRTVRQLVNEFGRDPGEPPSVVHWERFSTTVKNAWDRGKYEMAVNVTWLTTPNERADASKLYAKDTMPWHSCYFETDRAATEGAFLSESGFRAFPVLVPRWDVTGEDSYGTDSPGMTTLGDIKGLQLLERRKAQAIDKALNPPLTGPTSLRTQKTSLLPGDITYVDVREGMQGLKPIHEIRLEGLREVMAEIEKHEGRINRGFYADLFLMLANSQQVQPITAREVDERHEEKLLALGPVLERLNDELLDPLVDRTYSLMLAAGVIPPPPQELHGVALRVEYISIMSEAQKLVGVVGLDRFLQSTSALVQTWPEARHKVDIFEAITEYGDMLGANPKVVRSDEDAQKLVDAEQQSAQQAAAADQAERISGAAANLSKTPMGGNTALSAVLSGGNSGGVPA